LYFLVPQQNSNVAIGGARYPNAQTTSSAPQHSSNVAIGGARYPNAQTTSSVPQHYTTGEHSRIQTSAPVNHQTKIRSSSEVLLSKWENCSIVQNPVMLTICYKDVAEFSKRVSLKLNPFWIHKFMLIPVYCFIILIHAF